MAIAAGVESMSRVPMGSARQGADPFGPSVRARFPGLVPQGVSAELVRGEVGAEPRGSSTRTAPARTPGPPRRGEPGGSRGDRPGRRPDGAKVTEDETIRPGTTPEGLAGLRPRSAPRSTPRASPTWTGRSPRATPPRSPTGRGPCWSMSEQRAAALGLRPAGPHRRLGGVRRRPDADAHRADPGDPQGARARAAWPSGRSTRWRSTRPSRRSRWPGWPSSVSTRTWSIPAAALSRSATRSAASGVRLLTTLLAPPGSHRRALRPADNVRGRGHGERH